MLLDPVGILVCTAIGHLLETPLVSQYVTPRRVPTVNDSATNVTAYLIVRH